MAEADSRPDYFHIPVKALKETTRELICNLLNPTKVIPTDEGLPRDWRGLAQLVGLSGEKLPLVKSSQNPTEQLLNFWNDSSLGLLQTFLRQLDRWDIVDDTEDLIRKDALAYCASKEKAGNSAHIMDPEVDQDILTVDDVIRLEEGLEPQVYNAFLLFADEDIDFAKQIVDEMETKYKLKLCLRDRDLIGGLRFEHEAIMKLIKERCNRLIVVVSPNFLKSEANKFFVKFAQALGIDQKKRKVVPVLYERCHLPPELSYYFLLDYTRLGRLWDFWAKLHDSIQSPKSVSRTNVSLTNFDCNIKLHSSANKLDDSLSVSLNEEDLYKTKSLKDIFPVESSSVQFKKVTSLQCNGLKKSKSTSLENLKPKTWLKWFVPSKSQSKKEKRIQEACEF